MGSQKSAPFSFSQTFKEPRHAKEKVHIFLDVVSIAEGCPCNSDRKVKCKRRDKVEYGKTEPKGSEVQIRKKRAKSWRRWQGVDRSNKRKRIEGVGDHRMEGDGERSGAQKQSENSLTMLSAVH